MKSVILSCAVALATVGLQAQPLRCTPEKLVPGETVTLAYDQNQTILANEKELKATVLFLNSNQTTDRIKVDDVDFTLENGLFKAKNDYPLQSQSILHCFCQRSRRWNGYLGMFSDTYAVCLYRTGKYADALAYQALFNETQEFNDPETNERYCIYLEKAKGGLEAEAMLEKLIDKGAASESMKKQFLRLFQANNSQEAASQRYLDNLEMDAKAYQKEELCKKMIDREAPDFKLRNLNREEVALSSLKGKVVVLDFWATWCSPCKASFPGMQTALEAFRNRNDVVFLFIDTWGKGDEKEKNAADFIEKNKYNFTVLMDNDDKVVGNYKVEGIPTKFIVGKDGRIKFMSVGFNGTATLIEEIATMIDLAGEVKPRTIQLFIPAF